MKSTIKKIKQQQTIQPTKITKNRIIALILALILTATILSPQIPVKAQETTVENADISENNSSGGTSAGAGDKLPVDNSNNATINFSFEYTPKKAISYVSEFTNYTTKEDAIVLRTAIYSKDDYEMGYVVLLSKKSFSLEQHILTIMDTDETTSTTRNINASLASNGVYYAILHNYTGSTTSVKYEYIPEVNRISLPQIYNSYDDLISFLVLNTDLSKDDYKEPSETSAVYNKVLDFASISADYKVKYTIEKNKDGHFEFITPDDAGIQFDWINRTDIDGAYVKFTLYGEYYDSFWSTTYTNTYVTLTCDRKNDLTYLCKQKDMLLQAKEKCNGSKGYGFVVNYIYVQAFARIDGTLCRSRIYKFDSDLVSDYGNADSENDEWFPEITGGDSMPEEYEPDPENPDPEKTEPKPDKDDDTVVDTPIDNDPDVIINDDVTYLEAFKQFINVMKQGISYLGDFPALVAKVFSFIPPIFILFIGIGFAVALLLRFLGR